MRCIGRERVWELEGRRNVESWKAIENTDLILKRKPKKKKITITVI